MSSPGPARFLAQLRSEEPTHAVELRPPRSGLSRGGAMDTWIDLAHAIRHIVARGAFLMLTDSAVGEEEEENLQHLTANLAGEVDPRRVIPFLTCKHPLEYCLRYGERARARGLEALTVVGGDAGPGPPRCVPHAYELRQRFRARTPDLALGGWVNPHRSVRAQIEYLLDPSFEADYYLTQVVSHHELGVVERWLRAASDADLALPAVFGVFYYRNGKRETLERLSAFFPVSVEETAREFAQGTTPARHCARTIAALRGLGVRNVYICNLGARAAGPRFDAIVSEVDRLRPGG